MKTILFLLCALTWAAPKEKQPKMDPAMQKMLEYGTPGLEHQKLRALTGHWKAVNTMWAKPGAKPEKSQGESRFTWVLSGRFLKQEFEGTFNGQPFQGLGYFGFDKMRGEFQDVWMDSMMTGMMRSSGKWDEASKTIKGEGSFACAMTGEKDRWFRSEWKLPEGDGPSTFAMWHKDEKGAEYKAFEIVYTRLK